jgi:hypothetical protein
LRRSKNPAFELPQQPDEYAGTPQLLHPAPLTTTGAAGAGGGAGSAPASAADDMIRNAAFTTAPLLTGSVAEWNFNLTTSHRRLRDAFVKPL